MPLHKAQHCCMRHAELLHDLLDGVEITFRETDGQRRELLVYKLLWKERISSLIYDRYVVLVDPVSCSLTGDAELLHYFPHCVILAFYLPTIFLFLKRCSVVKKRIKVGATNDNSVLAQFGSFDNALVYVPINGGCCRSKQDGNIFGC